MFPAAVTEQLFNLGVHQDDLSALVDHHYSVRRGFEQPAEFGLRPPLLRNIDPRNNHVAWRLFRSGENRRRTTQYFSGLPSRAIQQLSYSARGELSLNLPEHVAELLGFLSG